ncbi:MAG: hypothetical protein F6K40_01205 [Okeania sp. SIO3I5]|uniref:hypothetical protein n=1 Tax=Okeania sp. SIO3I5 TaxID=2607805 RepID=UPI0013B982C8|nr:hypothetical protein [Okeania sp. SIO3I5]NEQ35001.1 hypothetical protein [Okeania sp. SIO3I5]
MIVQLSIFLPKCCTVNQLSVFLHSKGNRNAPSNQLSVISNAPSDYLPSQKKVRDGKISGVSLKSKRARHGFCHGYTDFAK